MADSADLQLSSILGCSDPDPNVGVSVFHLLIGGRPSGLSRLLGYHHASLLMFVHLLSEELQGKLASKPMDNTKIRKPWRIHLQSHEDLLFEVFCLYQMFLQIKWPKKHICQSINDFAFPTKKKKNEVDFLKCRLV